jgi:hypothetical protein
MTVTALTLDRFFELIGLHPLHGNQVTVHEIANLNTCGLPILQYSWQDADRVGREELAQAIYDAEQQISMWAGFDVGVRWVEDEVGYVGYNGRVTLEKKYLIEAGRRINALVEAGAAVSYSDEDGDGYFETALVTVSAVAGSNESEYWMYYPDHNGDDRWRIPVSSVSIAAGTATIKLRRERLVIEPRLEALAVEEVNGLDDDQFLEEVDVYRVYNDPDQAVVYVNRCCCTCGCEDTYTYGCLNVVDRRLSIARLGALACTTPLVSGPLCTAGGVPGPVKISYRAGITGQEWERAVAYLALAQLDRRLCGCAKIEHVAQYWQTDMAVSISGRGRAERSQLTNRKLDNPLGTTRAGLYAWELVLKNHVNA